MPIKPEKRDGKGVFQQPDDNQQLLDDTIINNTISKASERIVLFDVLHMLVVGFLKTITGFLGIEEELPVDKKGDKK